MKKNQIFNIDAEQIQQLEEHAKQTNLSKSAIVRSAIDQFFNSPSREAQIQRVTDAVCNRLFNGVSDAR